MNVPALVLGFNRPQMLRRNLIANADSGIEAIFVHLDGPRDLNPDDSDLILECEQVIEESRSLYRHVETFYSKKNLGCRLAVREGLDWFFTQNNFGLIIEDDVLISRNFVQFSSSMDKMKHEEDVWAINGWSPFNFKEVTTNPFYTRYFMPWGWATWSDKWANYQADIDWPVGSLVSNLETNQKANLPKEFEQYWNKIFSNQHALDSTWDYQWQYSIWKNGGVCISPPHRLTRNIGFTQMATHTRSTSFRSDLTMKKTPVLDVEKIDDEFELDLYLGRLLHNIVDSSSIKSSALLQRLRINRKNKYSFIPAFTRSLIYPGIYHVYFSKSKIKLFLIKIIPYSKKRFTIMIDKYRVKNSGE